MSEAAPTFLAGDFNSEPHQEAYEYLTSHAPVHDTYNGLPSKNHYGNFNTFTGFGFDKESPKRIDYIFVNRPTGSDSERPSWKIKNYGVLPNKFDDGVFNSDHRAVVVDLVSS